jgi:hypothetical protein
MQPNFDIALQEIYTPAKHAKDDYLCENFIIYPEGKEKNGGFLMGIIEIRATKSNESEKIIHNVINILKNEYYRQISTSPEIDKINIETIFEHALQKTNDSLIEMIQIGEIKFALENLNYLIAVAKPNSKAKEIDFHFAQKGQIKAYLLHKTKQNNYKVINIVENTPENMPDNKIKIFSSILSGKIFYHDTLYFCSEIFNNYIPSHKVNKVLQNNDLNSSINYYKNLINNVKNNSYLTYCAIFLKMKELSEIEKKPASEQSINNLINTTENTKKFLTPTFALNLRSNIGKMLKIFSPTRIKNRIKSPDSQKRVKFGILKYIRNAFRTLFSLIMGLFSKSKKSTSDQPKTSKSKSIISLLKKYRIIVIVVIIVLIAVIIASTFWISHVRDNQAKLVAYNTQVEEINKEINNAQVSLIYKNESASLNLINKASDKLALLPQESDEQITEHKNLQSKIDNIKYKLLKIEKKVPTLYSEIAVEGVNVNFTSLAVTEDNTFYAGSGNILHQIVDKTLKNSFQIINGDVEHLSTEDNEVVLITNQNKVVKVGDGPVTKSVDFSTLKDINDFAYYSGNLYVLDAQNEQIVKFTGSNDTFSAGTNWIKDKADTNLTQAVDIAIDGNIYILDSAGKIYKFFGGENEPLTTMAIQPKAESLSQIYTALDYNNLYILDNNSKRVIIFDKNGSLIKQLAFDTIESPITSIFINPDETTLYFTSNNKIYQSDL